MSRGAKYAGEGIFVTEFHGSVKWSDQEECHSKNRRAWCGSSHRIAMLPQIRMYTRQEENNSITNEGIFLLIFSQLSPDDSESSQIESVCEEVIKPVCTLIC